MPFDLRRRGCTSRIEGKDDKIEIVEGGFALFFVFWRLFGGLLVSGILGLRWSSLDTR